VFAVATAEKVEFIATRRRVAREDVVGVAVAATLRKLAEKLSLLKAFLESLSFDQDGSPANLEGEFNGHDTDSV
jgi:hypothetical protein